MSVSAIVGFAGSGKLPSCTSTMLWFAILLGALSDMALSQQQCTTTYQKFQGKCVPTNECTGGAFRNLCVGGNGIVCCVDEPEIARGCKVGIENGKEHSGICRGTFNNLFGASLSGPRADALFSHINNFVGVLGGVDRNCNNVASFLAQVGHESARLTAFEEFSDGSQYEGREDLGNIKAGDGRRFKGRGAIQITGRTNYALAGQALQLDLEGQPELAVFPSVAIATAVWYYTKSPSLSEYGTGICDDFREMTRFINGGYNGMEDRLNLLRQARTSMNCARATSCFVCNGQRCRNPLAHVWTKISCSAQMAK